VADNPELVPSALRVQVA